MSFDMQRAETCLQSLDLITLFQDVLGWTTPSDGCAIATQAFNHPYRAHCIAQRNTVRVWEIKLNASLELTVQLKARLYQAIHKKYPQPLIIFTERRRYRSLWYWCSQPDIPQSLVFIAQQPLAGWHPRLSYLADYDPALGELDLQPRTIHYAEITQQLRQQLDQLSEAITGIHNSRDRRWYGAVLIQRLILVHTLQQRGWLDGDVWYLHNHLGNSQQRQPDVFFRQVLQPLFTQGFSLPTPERPRTISWAGQLPYLGDLFYTHPLERQYTNIDILDTPFEAILVWFESPLWQQVNNSWQVSTVGLAFEQVLNERCEDEIANAFGTCCDLLINQYMMRHLGIKPGPLTPDVWDILFHGQPQHLRHLIQTILPQFSVLDPACGVGNLLVAIQYRLVDIYSVLIGQLKHSSDSQLKIWLQTFQAEHPSLLQTIYCRIFRYGFYGVDINPAVVDIARYQLLLGLVTIAQQPNDLEPLPSLDFNIVTGNSLVGFIRVDEAGFDRIQATETLLQGNLLHPLVAETYRTILSEKKVTLEHYRSQTHLLEELQQSIPHYALLEFFRTRINELDTKAQTKLNKLLLVEFSQTLGIQFKAAQLSEAPQRRLLRIEDLAMLQPFHWGYHFSHILEQTQGFNVILSRPPQGVFRPNPQKFVQQFYDLVSKYNVDIQTFKTTKQSLLTMNPEVVNAWLSYRSQYSLVTDYFYRSPQYDYQGPLIKGKRQRTQLRQHWLFIERCFHLLAPQGICGLVISNDIKNSPRGMTLRSLLEVQTESEIVMSLPGVQQPSTQCFLWFSRK